MSDDLWRVLVVVLTAAVVVEGVVLVAVMRQVGRLILNPSRAGMLPGDGGPAFDSEVRIHGLDFTKGVLALFVSPGCAACEVLEPALPDIAERYPDIRILPIVTGANARVRERHAAELGLDARGDLDFLIGEWNIPGTPFGVGIGPDARVKAKGVLTTPGQVEDVIEDLLRSWTPNEAAGVPRPGGPQVVFPPQPSTQQEIST